MTIHHILTTLPNGIRLVTIPKKDTEAVSVQIFFKVGSRYEDITESGTAHFLEHMAFKGTKKRPSPLDLANPIEEVGGSQNAWTNYEATGYWIYLPAKHIELALDILADMLRNSLFPKDEIEKEKGPILEEYKMRLVDSPNGFFGSREQMMVYGDSPLGRPIIGSREIIANMTREKLIAFYKKFYNPDNMVISIAGGIDEGKTIKLVKQYFGSLKGKTKHTFEFFDRKIQTVPQIGIFHKDLEQISADILFQSFGRQEKDEKRTARGLLRSILNNHSQLFNEIREKRGLAYSVGAGTSTYQEIGEFYIGGGYDREKFLKAFDVIYKKIREVKEKGFPKKEIDRAKSKWIGRMLMSTESSSTVADDYGSDILFENKITTYDETIKQINAVTNDDIKKIAKEIFIEDNMKIAIMGKLDESFEKKIRKNIKI